MNRLVIILLSFAFPFAHLYGKDLPKVLIAILAKDTAHLLPEYLYCIENLAYPKERIDVYINTNNNRDNTPQMLQQWVKDNQSVYSSITYDEHMVENLDKTEPHEWTPQRFKVLAQIRNKSLQMAKKLGSDFYFVVDCDNFITQPETLLYLVNQDKPIIAPMLASYPNDTGVYSNYFCGVNEWGYYQHHSDYYQILHRHKIGAFVVPLVHCTYLIKASYIDQLSYTDDTDDYEFVIFSRTARKNGVTQYICNVHDFGFILRLDGNLTLQEELIRTRDYFNKHPIIPQN